MKVLSIEMNQTLLSCVLSHRRPKLIVKKIQQK